MYNVTASDLTVIQYTYLNLINYHMIKVEGVGLWDRSNFELSDDSANLYHWSVTEYEFFFKL